MKVNFNPVLVLIIWSTSISLFSQSPCHLVLGQDKLVGECEDKLFTGIEIVLDREYDKIDSATLFKILPKDGFLIIQKKHKIAAQFVITERAGFPQIMLKPTDLPRVGWYTFDSLSITDREINFLIDKDPDVPFSNEDLEIIAHVKKLFKDPLNWNKNDDRRCQDDIKNDTYSFFCALQTASINVAGEYNHRNAVM